LTVDEAGRQGIVLLAETPLIDGQDMKKPATGTGF